MRLAFREVHLFFSLGQRVWSAEVCFYPHWITRLRERKVCHSSPSEHLLEHFLFLRPFGSFPHRALGKSAMDLGIHLPMQGL
jgi:hypothetical protein